MALQFSTQTIKNISNLNDGASITKELVVITNNDQADAIDYAQMVVSVLESTLSLIKTNEVVKELKYLESTGKWLGRLSVVSTLDSMAKSIISMEGT